MITIVALGNPGEEYAKTRHNVGWFVMREILRIHNLPTPFSSSKFNADISEGVLYGKEVGVLFPTTFMNRSGGSVKRYVESLSSSPMLVVVHDEVHLPFGEVKISKDRGAGGHNGVRSIITECGTQDFIRIRIGIAPSGLFAKLRQPKGEKLPKYVLGKFRPAELRKLGEVTERVEKALTTLITSGVEKAMQECN